MSASDVDLIVYFQGRVLYDVLLYKVESNEPTVLLECDSSITSQLISSLEKYKLRKKVTMETITMQLLISLHCLLMSLYRFLISFRSAFSMEGPGKRNALREREDVGKPQT